MPAPGSQEFFKQLNASMDEFLFSKVWVPEKEIRAYLGMREQRTEVKNPRRVLAGRLNRRKWKGLTAAGRQRLREAALRNRPWEHSTGPRTLEGKRRSAVNGKRRQKGTASVRERRRRQRALRAVWAFLEYCMSLEHEGTEVKAQLARRPAATAAG